MTTPTLLSARELADELGMGLSTVHQYAADGTWPDGAVYRWGGTVRFDLDAILQAGRSNASRPVRQPAPVQPADVQVPSGRSLRERVATI